jgi:hypothetical protein
MLMFGMGRVLSTGAIKQLYCSRTTCSMPALASAMRRLSDAAMASEFWRNNRHEGDTSNKKHSR